MTHILFFEDILKYCAQSAECVSQIFSYLRERERDAASGGILITMMPGVGLDVCSLSHAICISLVEGGFDSFNGPH